MWIDILKYDIKKGEYVFVGILSAIYWKVCCKLTEWHHPIIQMYWLFTFTEINYPDMKIFMHHLVLSTINPNIVFVWIIARTAPFVFLVSYCVTDRASLAPFAPDALFQ